MAFTLRLPDELMARAQGYARGLGLSLNGLIAVALAEYLNGRQAGQRLAAEQAPVIRAPEVATSAGGAPVKKPSKRAVADELRRLEQARHNLEVERKSLDKARSKQGS